ncbi:hypothetical protein KMW28_15940 [Flammeovirga yaeyamensis]|uniref:Two component regulator three Y domain-containing protein n=1 Tax=Flammeovirga yaeyamensis TaxID=367791 RepID=A0AAX1N439_9BACT|nr:triple tyrosine motif-containing protein [Flammeovirga yaeyamensis]MBB3698500.1 hypothetical protein [Flammeovirga yaeyamensis]NMF34151.1 hypothetical protein [Flammeovirga yaeyamensis]QWG01136.1 hypothetical protein KMW28_15940 [Flammeovirga yaeyamensis]
MKNQFTFFTFSIVLMINFFCIAQDEIKLYTSPQITYYDKAEYKAEQQNWCIAQGDDGVMYMANTLGLLEFDGERCILHPTDAPLHTVTIHDNVIYVGGINIMGYFKKENAALRYYSIKAKEEMNDVIWKSFVINNQIVYQAFDGLYFYHLQSNVITYRQMTEGNISFAYLNATKDQFYYQNLYNNIKLSNNRKVISIIAHPQFKKWIVKYIHETPEGLVIGTELNGLYFFRNGELTQAPKELSDFIKEGRLNAATPLDNEGNYAFGTLDKGLIIGNIITGKIQYIINSKNGLSSNRIYSLFHKDGLLWVGTDVGLAKVNLKYPVRFINDPLAELGTVHDAENFNGKLYVGTNQGVYFTDQDIDSPQITFTKLVDSDGQVWSLTQVENQLFCGHNRGIFEITPNFERRWRNGGGYTFLKSQLFPNRMYQTSYRGLNIWEKRNGRWEFGYPILSINTLTKSILEANDSTLYCTDEGKEVFKIELSKDGQQLMNIEKVFGDSCGSRFNEYQLFTLGNHQLLSTSNRLIDIDGKKKQFPFKSLQQVSPEVNGYTLIASEGKLQLYHYEDNTLVPLENSLSELVQRQVYGYENISQLDDEHLLMSFTKGVGIFKPQDLEDYHYAFSPPEVRGIYFSDVWNKEIYNGSTKEIPFDYNSVKIEFSTKNYFEKVNYSVKLTGIDADWVNVEEKAEMSYQNLPYGEYTFMIKDNTSQLQTNYTFRILRPWYLSNTLLVVYALLIIGAIYFLILGIRFYIRWERKKMLILKRKDLNIQRERNKREIEVIKSKNLKIELLDKDESLSEMIANNIKNKEIINELKEEVVTYDEVKHQNKNGLIKKMNTILNSKYNDIENWLVFEASFKKLHPGFFDNLKSKHPNLTKEDLKLCTYLKINLSSKELSRLFNITPQSVDLKRYRLRKKMQLDRSVNLTEYISSF